jgi:hypothetical protein
LADGTTIVANVADENAPAWKEPTWTRYNNKHRPRAGVPWNQIIKETTNNPAKYHPDITDDKHKKLELDCVAKGQLIDESGSVRSYYMDVGYLIGASDGMETTIVYAEHGRSGDLHGRPITKEQLAKAGVKI